MHLTSHHQFNGSEIGDYLACAHLPAERGKGIQSLLILGGVAHHRVVTPSSLHRTGHKHSDVKSPPKNHRKLDLDCAPRPGDAPCWGSSAETLFSRRV